MRYLLMSLSDLDDEILERLPTDIRGAIKNGTLKILPKDFSLTLYIKSGQPIKLKKFNVIIIFKFYKTTLIN